MKEINPVALFRLSVLGPLVSPEQLGRGELQQGIRELAQREYAIPNSGRRMLGEKTIQSWYYLWRKGGIEALVPKVRVDRGQSKMSAALQEATQRPEPLARRNLATSNQGAAMTRNPKPTNPRRKKIVLPALSDEALIQIQDFLHLALDVFEDHYGQQLDLFYHSLWQQAHEFETEEFSE